MSCGLLEKYIPQPNFRFSHFMHSVFITSLGLFVLMFVLPPNILSKVSFWDKTSTPFAYILPSIIISIIYEIAYWQKAISDFITMKRNLHSLNDDQREALNNFITRNTRAFFIEHSFCASPLVEMKILKKVDTQTFLLDDKYYKYLMKNKNLVKDTKAIS